MARSYATRFEQKSEIQLHFYASGFDNIEPGSGVQHGLGHVIVLGREIRAPKKTFNFHF